MSENMNAKDRLKKLTEGFMSLPEEGKQYTLAIVDALAYASGISRMQLPPDESESGKSA